jgi:hypothetical protein
MRGWLKEQWHQIRGNAKYDLVRLAGATMIAMAYALLQKIRHLSFDWYVLGILFLISAFSFFYFSRGIKKIAPSKVGEHLIPLPVVRTMEEWTELGGKLTIVTNRKFEYVEEVVDGKAYVNCTFTHVNTFYDGTAPVSFSNCTFDADTISHFHTHSPGIAQWMETLRTLGIFRPDLKHAINPLPETEIASRGIPENTPELIIDYHYLDDATWSKPSPSPDKPLIVKNVTEGKNAFNVLIRPLITEEGTAQFIPQLVSCVKGGDEVEFNARVDGGYAGDTNQLLTLLQKSYKENVPDYNVAKDLFGEKSFTVTIEYEDSSGKNRYVAECEITYRKWHNEMHTGKHRIRKII